MPQRYTYDLSHLSYMTGKIGRLQTISAIPVMAGDSMSVSVNGIMRMSPLRRDMVMDAKVDLFGFFVPYRHVYSNWVDLMKEGAREDEALATDTVSLAIHCLGQSKVSGTTPRWLTRGYLKIWKRYFRLPDDSSNDAVDDGTFSTLGDHRRYGYPCARLKSYASTGRALRSALDGDDTVTVTAGS